MREKALRFSEKMQGNDAIRLRNTIKAMSKLTIRWANLYHNEREQASKKIYELEKEIKILKDEHKVG